MECRRFVVEFLAQAGRDGQALERTGAWTKGVSRRETPFVPRV